MEHKLVYTDKKLQILAVDDNSIVLATIDQALKNRYDVITANSGERALRFLKMETPALILLDVQMAPMDGIETLRQIRALENGKDIPVIMLTAKNDKNTVFESSKFGITDYMLKPFEAKDLIARIDTTLRKIGKM